MELDGDEMTRVAIIYHQIGYMEAHQGLTYITIPGTSNSVFRFGYGESR